MHTDAGELYEATGTLYSCDERLCPSCLARRSRNARKKAREAIKRAGRNRNEIPYFITFTIPTMTARECSLLKSLELLLHTWRLFTKRKFFAEHFRAGVKGSEFTIGDKRRLERERREWLADVDGWHPHIHFVVIAKKWVKAAELRAVWTSCYKSACAGAEFDITPTINTKDGLLNCHLRYVTEHRASRTRSNISLESAIVEVCKYITKFDSWLTIPEAELLEIANIKRWPRMFELIGECRNSSPKIENTEQSASEGTRERYVHTTDLSAADSSPPKRIKLERSLREIGKKMIERGEREKWRVLLDEHVRKAQEFRRGQLACRYSFATFRTLEGKKWSGALECMLADPDAVKVIEWKLVTEFNRWEETLKHVDHSELRERVAGQERERAHAYVEYGRDALAGDETLEQRRAWMYRNIESEISVEENAQKIARAYQWKLSDEIAGMTQEQVTEYFRPRVQAAKETIAKGARGMELQYFSDEWDYRT